jgi:hypothetical protein
MTRRKGEITTVISSTNGRITSGARPNRCGVLKAAADNAITLRSSDSLRLTIALRPFVR